MERLINTVHYGKNSLLLKEISELYFKSGDKIADVTYGKGAFWTDIKADIEIIGTDLLTGTDFRNLPYKNNSFDHSVIDPPYSRRKLKGINDCYQTSEITTHKEILNLYKSGIEELARITKRKGLILVKCQDEVCGGKNRWTHIEIVNFAESINLRLKDLFILVNNNKIPTGKIIKQQHARKNHSYMLIFERA